MTISHALYTLHYLCPDCPLSREFLVDRIRGWLFRTIAWSSSISARMPRANSSLAEISGNRWEISIVKIPRDKINEALSHAHLTRAMWWATLIDEATLREWLVIFGRRRRRARWRTFSANSMCG